jgi:hypothetical protein
MLEASHFDANEAYAAVDRHRLEDNEPYAYRTKDGGKTWTKITSGLPRGVYLQTIREDPKRRGLLVAGTELALFVSFDDGDSWQPLQLNLPPASMRDVAFHDNDLIVATHGRGFWVLDDVSVLRQLTPEIAGAAAHLFKPADAIILPPSTDDGTPTQKDEPEAENPPVGAIVDYYLKGAASGPLTIEILNGSGAVVRHHSSADHARRERRVAAAAGAAVGRGGNAPLRVGLPSRSARGWRPRARRPRRRGRRRWRRPRRSGAGRARHLQRASHGRRPDVHAAVDAETGSAGTVKKEAGRAG